MLTLTMTNTPTMAPPALLEEWAAEIAALDAALTDVAAARADIDTETTTLERVEASAVLSIEGGNAETRKARLTLLLADDARYQAHDQALRTARLRLLDAERRVSVSKERCRRVRASLALYQQES